jgi:hypothetical protein
MFNRTRTSSKDKILDFFFNPERNTLTVRQARARFGVKNISARIHDLRKEGFPIYTNSKELADGRKITFYRLGNASARYNRNVVAGRTKLALKSLYSLAA